MSEIIGEPLNTQQELLRGANKLRDMGARNVLISMAGDGAMLVSEDGKVFISKPPEGEVVNSVGAGDSMVAGFLAGFLQSGNYEYALKLGIAAGSATAFSLELATKEEIDSLFAAI